VSLAPVCMTCHHANCVIPPPPVAPVTRTGGGFLCRGRRYLCGV
jgi:hypothetical protein